MSYAPVNIDARATIPLAQFAANDDRGVPRASNRCGKFDSIGGLETVQRAMKTWQAALFSRARRLCEHEPLVHAMENWVLDHVLGVHVQEQRFQGFSLRDLGSFPRTS